MKATMTLSSGNAFGTNQYRSGLAAPGAHLTVASSNRHNERHAPAVHLTPRQLEVLALLCEGLPNKLICRRLNIASGTVKAHISSILHELGVASRLQAVVAARRHGLLREVDHDSGEADRHDSSEAGSGGYAQTLQTRRFGHGHS
jgi:DNA-binding NarL/FixJ family response regulator